MLTLVSETDDILKHPITEKFNFSDPITDPEELASFMVNSMLKHNGIGLAAPQIGLSYRVFVMGNEKNASAYFNPTIIEASKDLDKKEEGCLSFPGLYIKIARPVSLIVEYQNIYGDVKQETLYGLWARCFNHELDHLNGILFTSKAGRTALSIARSRRKKHLRRMINE